jgi:hypothetical protein
VARAAVDIEALLAAIDERFINGKWQVLHGDLLVLAGKERLILLQRPARNRSFDERARAGAVGEERARPQPAVFRLVVHVLAATGDAGQTHSDNDE